MTVLWWEFVPSSQAAGTGSRPWTRLHRCSALVVAGWKTFLYWRMAEIVGNWSKWTLKSFGKWIYSVHHITIIQHKRLSSSCHQPQHFRFPITEIFLANRDQVEGRTDRCCIGQWVTVALSIVYGHCIDCKEESTNGLRSFTWFSTEDHYSEIWNCCSIY